MATRSVTRVFTPFYITHLAFGSENRELSWNALFAHASALPFESQDF
jgi:hypothetical protein